MRNIPAIRDVGELLDLLRDSLSARAVAYVGDDLAVCDCANGNPARPIAWIDDTGSARELLNKAYDADLAGDASAWAALPLWTLLLDLGFIGTPQSPYQTRPRLMV